MYIYVCVCICIHIYILYIISISHHPCVGTEVASISCLLWIMPQWIWECRNFWDLDFISFGYIPGIEIARSYASILIFWETFTCFLQMDVPVYMPINSANIPFPPHPLQHLLLVFLLVNPNRCEVISHCCPFLKKE